MGGFLAAQRSAGRSLGDQSLEFVGHFGVSRNTAARPSAGRLTAPRDVPGGGGDVEKVSQQEMAVLGGNALRMKLNAVHRQCAVRQSHDETVTGFCRNRKLVRQACPLDHEGMVARCLERAVDAAEYAAALV